MKAEEAKAKADAAVPGLIEAEFNTIIANIDTETGKGAYSLTVEALADENKAKLKELGYKVTVFGKSGHKISWGSGGTDYQPKGTPKAQ